MDEDDVVAVIGVETSSLGAISSSARRAYDGFQCNECRRVCGVVDSDGRCQTCGPLPDEKPELSEAEKWIQRERGSAEHRRRNRLDWIKPGTRT